MPDSDYHRRQREAILAIRRHLAETPGPSRSGTQERIKPYLAFRGRVSRFQEEHFAGICTVKCFTSRTSACCGREGILTFFADLVVDLLLAGEEGADRLLAALDGDRGDSHCVYLGTGGCTWTLKPIVCGMFLCDEAKARVLENDPALRGQWEELRREERLYTYPDRPVLFDDLERAFIESGCESPLMYFHLSPGLVRLKERHRVGRPPLRRRDGAGRRE